MKSRPSFILQFNIGAIRRIHDLARPRSRRSHYIDADLTTLLQQDAMNSISRAIVPAVRRAASSAIPAAKQSAQEGFKAVEVLYAVPPLLAIVGYGGTVCFDDTGALRRIRRSFAEVPH